MLRLGFGDFGQPTYCFLQKRLKQGNSCEEVGTQNSKDHPMIIQKTNKK